MKTDPRLIFGAKLQKRFGAETANEILHMFDVSFHGFSIEQTGTALVPVGNNNWNILDLYINTKLLEGKSKAGMNNYKLTLKHFLASVGKPIEKIVANDIRSFLYTYKEQKGVSDRTLDRYRMQICSFFQWCQNEEIITANPAKNVKQIKYVAKQREALSHMEVEIIRATEKNELDNAIFETLLSTGCRISELLNIKTEEIDWHEGSVKVIGKGKKEREVYIKPKAQVAIHEYLKLRKDDNPHLFVFLEGQYKTGNTIYPRYVQMMMKDLREKSGIKKELTPHILRHTFATFALEADIPIEEVATLLGHSSLETTRIYAEISRSKLKNDFERKMVG